MRRGKRRALEEEDAQREALGAEDAKREEEGTGRGGCEEQISKL